MDLLQKLEHWLDSLDLQADHPRANRDFDEAWNDLERFLADDAKTPEHFGREHERGSQDPRNFDGPGGDEYRVLGVKPGTPFSEIEVSYRNLLRRYHPDRYPMDSKQHRAAEEITKRLNAAYSKMREHNIRRQHHHR